MFNEFISSPINFKMEPFFFTFEYRFYAKPIFT